MPEALERLTECYLALGLGDEARQTAAVLGYNYPGSKWYSDTYALVSGGQEPDGAQQSWLGRVADWILLRFQPHAEAASSHPPRRHRA